MKSLVLGTRNEKKRKELVEQFQELDLELETLAGISHSIDVEETGSTFRENAILKAVEQARVLNRWVLGEDSGVSVNALDGAPGIYSARYSGPEATDEKNNRLLLEKLDGLPAERRRAWYTCYMVLANPNGDVVAEADGRCYGRILTRSYGSGGFGYDPLFVIPEYGLTFGQLGSAVKKVISHRARAARIMLPKLKLVFD